MAQMFNQVKLATTQNIDLSAVYSAGNDKIDNVLLDTGDRVLVKAQSERVQNGIYFLNSSGHFQRADDFANNTQQVGSTIVFVQQGETFADTGWVLSNDGTITVGVDQIQFENFTVNLKIQGADIPSSIILREEKGYPLTNSELDNNFKYLGVSLTQKLNIVDYTPSSITDRLNSLSAATANLNAWKLQDNLPSSTPLQNTIALRDEQGGLSSVIFHGDLDGNADTATNADYATLSGNVTGTVAVNNGGTGATDAAGARLNLDVLCKSGDTVDGKLILSPKTNVANINLNDRGQLPNNLVTGDVWFEGSVIKYYNGSDSKTIAPLQSPTFTGTVAAPTASVDSNSNIVATTAHVKLVKAVIDTDIAKKADIAAPTFTTKTVDLGGPGAPDLVTLYPTAPTLQISDNSTAISTTAYVTAKLSEALTSYDTKTQVDGKISTALVSYDTKTQVDGKISTALTSYYTKTEVDTAFSNYTTTTNMNLAISNAVSSKANKTYVDELQNKWGTSRKYVQSTAPTDAAEGDFWFKI